MSSLVDLADRSQVQMQRERALRLGVEQFVLDLAATEFKERLSQVNRSFTRPAVVSGYPPFWKEFLPGCTSVQDDPILQLGSTCCDLVLHAVALHWASDPLGQMIQARRALEADGLFMAATLAGQTLCELRAALAQAEIEVTGGLSPRVAPMGEIRDLGALLQRAGFAMPVADSICFTATYPDIWALMRDLRAMGETNALAARLRKATRRPVFRRAAEIYEDCYSEGDGRFRATFELVFLTGWAPHESQPKPLRPGSAQTSLADALGTSTTKVGKSSQDATD